MPVTRFEVMVRRPLAGGRAFGDAGPYEELAGRLHFAVDPEHAANRAITDVGLAPQGPGRVASPSSSDVSILLPVDRAKASGRLILDVVNRGNKVTVPDFNHATRPALGAEQRCSSAGGRGRRLADAVAAGSSPRAAGNAISRRTCGASWVSRPRRRWTQPGAASPGASTCSSRPRWTCRISSSPTAHTRRTRRRISTSARPSWSCAISFDGPAEVIPREPLALRPRGGRAHHPGRLPHLHGGRLREGPDLPARLHGRGRPRAGPRDGGAPRLRRRGSSTAARPRAIRRRARSATPMPTAARRRDGSCAP